MKQKYLSSGIQKKIFKIYAYITSSCTFIIYDRSMELYAPYFKK